MSRRVEADSHSLTLRLAGTFTPTEDLYREGQRAQELNVRLFERTKRAGASRADLVVDDLTFVFEQLAAVRVRDPNRTRELRRRYLALTLRAIETKADQALPGPPPTWSEIVQRWQDE
ncbi:MAG: hypothetical protein DLM64_10835 [Solirubrobacterales bacterium]|nr:MAG: hypothetical protein DLM64_10835 [Solirubrobacterales bacterium]